MTRYLKHEIQIVSRYVFLMDINYKILLWSRP